MCKLGNVYIDIQNKHKQKKEQKTFKRTERNNHMENFSPTYCFCFISYPQKI